MDSRLRGNDVIFESAAGDDESRSGLKDRRDAATRLANLRSPTWPWVRRSIRFARHGAFSLVLGPNSRVFVGKSSEVCSLQHSHVLCFQ